MGKVMQAKVRSEDSPKNELGENRQAAPLSPIAPSAPVAPAAPAVLAADSLDRFAGTWFQTDVTRMGQIEGNLLTWACELPPSEVRLSPSGEVLIEVDGQVYEATFKNDALHFNDCDIWTKSAAA